MTFRPLTFAIKYLLPLLALLAILYAGWRTHAGRPSDQTLTPVIAPAGSSLSTPSSGTATATTPLARIAGAGVVEPSSEIVIVSPNTSGVVSNVNVAAGEVVKKGQTLYTLDARELTAQQASRAAEIAALVSNAQVAQAELADKQALLKLYQNIGDERAMAREELLKRQGAVDMAQARLRSAQAQIKSARAAATQTQTQLELLTVRAPMAGTVLQLRLKPGEFAQTNNPQLLSMGNTTPLHVRVDFDEADVSRLPLGPAASVSARGASGAPVAATFVRAEPVISPKRSLTNAADERVDTRVLQVIYALPANTPGFYVGQQIDAFVNAQPTR